MGYKKYFPIPGMCGILVILGGCTSGNLADNSEVESGLDSIRDACSQALRIANSEPTLPALTQCEVQTDGSDRIFVLQFADPSEDRIALEQGTNVDTVFNRPLSAIRDVWSIARADGGIDKYIVSFQDPCQTVWDLDSELVDKFLAGQRDVESVTNTMRITSFLC